MDDQKNSKYSRSPELEDIITLCRALNENKVDYVLIGGIAVILHGFPRGTRDVDLLIDPHPNNIKKIKSALSYLPDNVVSSMKDDEVLKYTVVRIADEIVIDLMAKACGIDFAQAYKGVKTMVIDGVTIPLANQEMLIRMKDTVRPSDKADVEFLKAQIEEIKDKKK